MGGNLFLITALTGMAVASILLWYRPPRRRCKNCRRWFSAHVANKWPGKRLYQCDACGEYFTVAT
jgi:hypothetical protein